MHWWPRMMEMHSDAFRCICNGLARNLMPSILALAITAAAKTDIYNAVDSKYRQNWYPVHSLLLQTLANGCNAFVKARFVAIHIAWVLNIFTQRSHYILLHILQNVSGAPAHPNICWIYATYHRHLTPRETPCWSLKALHSQRKYFETVNPTGG